MTIQPISHASVALYITPADLKEFGLTPSALTLEHALELTHTAFDEAGIELDGTIEIEAFPNTCGVLVFARVKQRETMWLSFPDSEHLLTAAEVLPEPWPQANLFFSEGKYWMSLPGNDERAAAILSEFGAREACGAASAARMAEHGIEVLRGDAIGTLRGYFMKH